LRKALGILVSLCLTSCATQLEPIKRLPAAPAPSFDSAQVQNSVEFSKLVIGLERGAVYGQLGSGLLCIPGPPLKWDGGTSTLSEGPLVGTIRDTFTKAGLKLAGDPKDLFNVGPDSIGELVVAAKIEKVDLRVCGVGTYTGQKGAAYVKIEWQVFSRSAGAVVLTTTTEGSFETTEFKPGGSGWISGSVEEATKQFLSNPETKRLFGTPARRNPKGETVRS
jgi:serine protease Do